MNAKECGALIGPEGESCGVPADACREHRRESALDLAVGDPVRLRPGRTAWPEHDGASGRVVKVYRGRSSSGARVVGVALDTAPEKMLSLEADDVERVGVASWADEITIPAAEYDALRAIADAARRVSLNIKPGKCSPYSGQLRRALLALDSAPCASSDSAVGTSGDGTPEAEASVYPVRFGGGDAPGRGDVAAAAGTAERDTPPRTDSAKSDSPLSPIDRIFGACPDLPEPCTECGEALCECPAAPSSGADYERARRWLRAEKPHLYDLEGDETDLAEDAFSLARVLAEVRDETIEACVTVVYRDVSNDYVAHHLVACFRALRPANALPQEKKR